MSSLGHSAVTGRADTGTQCFLTSRRWEEAKVLLNSQERGHPGPGAGRDTQALEGSAQKLCLEPTSRESSPQGS